MAVTPLTYAQAAKRRDGLFAEIEQLCWKAKASSDWANVTIGNVNQPVFNADGSTMAANDRAALLADYTILSNVYDLLHNRNPAQGGVALGVDVMAAAQAKIIPGVTAE